MIRPGDDPRIGRKHDRQFREPSGRRTRLRAPYLLKRDRALLLLAPTGSGDYAGGSSARFDDPVKRLIDPLYPTTGLRRWRTQIV
jgi:hypothetical protein